jgi:rhodanese-related sulfurtransferase
MIIDVRPEEAYAEGHIVNSKHFPLAEIESNPDAIKKKKDKVLLTVCDSGPVAKRAADALRKSGFESAFSLQGGLAAWRTENLPLVK